MKTIVRNLVICCLLATGNSTAIAQIKFQKTFNSGASPENLYSAAQVSNGGYIVVGTSENITTGFSETTIIELDALGNKIREKAFGAEYLDGGWQFVDETDSSYVLLAASNLNVFLSEDLILLSLKKDFSQVYWTKSVGGNVRETGRQVVKGTDGYYGVGWSSSMGNWWQHYTFKVNFNGTFAWSRSWGGANVEKGEAIALTTGGGFVATGENASNPIDGGDAVVYKFNATGDTVQWGRTYSTGTNESALGIIQTQDGHYVVSGSLLRAYVGAGSYRDFYMMKLDSSNGSIIWSYIYGDTLLNPAGWWPGHRIIELEDGSLVTGGTRRTASSGLNGYLLKTDANGILQWSRSYGSSSNDEIFDIVRTQDGGFLLTGFTQGFGAGSNYNGYIIKTDANGLSGCHEDTTLLPQDTVSWVSAARNPTIDSNTDHSTRGALKTASYTDSTICIANNGSSCANAYLLTEDDIENSKKFIINDSVFWIKYEKANCIFDLFVQGYDTATYNIQKIKTYESCGTAMIDTLKKYPSSLLMSNKAMIINNGFVYLKLELSDTSHFYFGDYKTVLTPPLSPAPQALMSDTPRTFVFEEITNQGWGNKIEWSFDSTFSTSQVAVPPVNISFSLNPGTDALIFIRSIDTVTGCVSAAASTIAILHPVFQEFVPDTFRAVCAGTTDTIRIESSLTGNRYDLKRNDTIVNTGLGNGGLLKLSTGVIDTSTVFSLWKTDTLTSITTLLDSAIFIMAVGAVDTPVFVEPELLVHTTDSICYLATAENAVKIRYRITRTALIDSLSGCVHGIGNNFTVTAVATGLGGCGTAMASVAVTATNVAPPPAPDPVAVVVDTPQTAAVNIENVTAGAGGNQIQWSYTPDFAVAYTLSSPATITLNLEAGTDTTIYIRSKHNETLKVSRAVSTKAGVQYKLISAGILDKSQWNLIPEASDEFDYKRLYPYDEENISFTNKWALNYCWKNDIKPCDPDDICNHFINSDDVIDYCNHGYQTGNPGTDGAGGEITFRNGIAEFVATRLDDFQRTCNGKNRTLKYKTGKMSLKNMLLDFSTPKLLEIRCRTGENGSHGAFWTRSTEEFDIMENNGGTNRTTANIQDVNYFNNPELIWGMEQDTGTGTGIACQGVFYKHTPCNYAQDWHTYSMMISTNRIICFVDGKETYSHDRTNVTTYNGHDYRFPSNLGFLESEGRMMIALDIDHYATASHYYMDVDYVRVYEPKPANSSNPPQCLQNIQNGVAKTLENPNFLSQAYNHNRVIITQPQWRATSDISSQLNFLGSGQSAMLMYRSTVHAGLNFHVGMNLHRQNNQWVETIMSKFKPVLVFPPWGIPYVQLVQTNWFDVGSEIVPIDDNTVCYRNINNELVLLKKNGPVWLEFKAHINNKKLLPIKNCGGNIMVDDLKRIWYRSTDNKIYNFNPADGALTLVNTDGSVHSFTVAKCGCLIFYRTNSPVVPTTTGVIRQLSWWGNWTEFPVPSVVASPVYGNMLLDESKSRLYYISNDNAVYQYTYNYAASNLSGLFKLGNQGMLDTKNNIQRCNQYNNAFTGLTLSPDKEMLYYIGTDLKIWYFFNDKEFSEALPQGQIVPDLISKENWNKTPLLYSTKSVGPLVFEPGGNRLFYGGYDQKLNYATWTNADNALNCPYAVGENVSFTSGLYRYADTSGVSTEETTEQHNDSLYNAPVAVQVFPNPSDHTFTFNITGHKDNNANIEILIIDITGKAVTVLNGKNTGELKWDASKMPDGVYFYYSNTHGKTFTGRLIKL